MKIRLVHILTDIHSQREQASIASLAPVANYGIEYVQSVNEIYNGDKWQKTKNWANEIYPNHSQRHYGAFDSFRKAVLLNFDYDIDALILCECDCVLTVPAEVFAFQVFSSLDFCRKGNLSYYSFGTHTINDIIQSTEHDSDDEFPHSYITDKIVCAHCIMIPNHERNFVMSEIAYRPWETPDVWFNMVFHTRGISKFGIIRERMAKQHEGISLIDNHFKNEQNFKGVY